MTKAEPSAKNRQDGAMLKTLREGLGITQNELAHHLGMNNGRSLRYWEQGIAPVPLPVLSDMQELWQAVDIASDVMADKMLGQGDGCLHPVVDLGRARSPAQLKTEQIMFTNYSLDINYRLHVAAVTLAMRKMAVYRKTLLHPAHGARIKIALDFDDLASVA